MGYSSAKIGYSNSGQRGGWTVQVPAATLAQACDERMTYHRERLDFWTQQLAAAEQNLRVNECQKKAKDHARDIESFHAFKAFFVTAGQSSLPVTADDVLYFNLANADNGEDDEVDD